MKIVNFERLDIKKLLVGHHVIKVDIFQCRTNHLSGHTFEMAVTSFSNCLHSVVEAEHSFIDCILHLTTHPGLNEPCT